MDSHSSCAIACPVSSWSISNQIQYPQSSHISFESSSIPFPCWSCIPVFPWGLEQLPQLDTFFLFGIRICRSKRWDFPPAAQSDSQVWESWCPDSADPLFSSLSCPAPTQSDSDCFPGRAPAQLGSANSWVGILLIQGDLSVHLGTSSLEGFQFFFISLFLSSKEHFHQLYIAFIH